MAILNPRQAAAIAAGVYDLRDDDLTTIRQFKRNALGTQGLFSIDDASRFTGRSGVQLFNTLSGFGFIAAGEGQFAGDVLIATRGTDLAVDWLTDLNIGWKAGPSGTIVHAGFNATWKSFAPVLQKFLAGRNPTRIHCVGHSLGGALAFLNADYIAANRMAEVRVYTFGAPRTGLQPFARQLTERVGTDNILRVSHPSDPVPMIPLFPFHHVPFEAEELQIAQTTKSSISGAAHKMRDSYIPGVADVTDWEQLRVRPRSRLEIDSLLDGAAAGDQKGSASLLDKIKRVLYYFLNGVSLTFSVGFTVLDQLASMLARAAQVTKEMSRGIEMLVGMIFRFLGRTALTGVQLTTAFLRWVLDLLFNAVRLAAHRAVSLLR